jgi:hypothetical protein
VGTNPVLVDNGTGLGLTDLYRAIPTLLAELPQIRIPFGHRCGDPAFAVRMPSDFPSALVSSALTARRPTFGQHPQATLAQHGVRPRVAELTEVTDMAQESGMDRDAGKQAGGKQAGGVSGEDGRQGVEVGGNTERVKGRGELEGDEKWTVKWDGQDAP